MIAPLTGVDHTITSSMIGPCHLLRLPGELRNRIYGLAILSENKQPGSSFLTTNPHRSEDEAELYGLWNNPPRLAVSCKQIRDEALGIYYGQACFELITPNPICKNLEFFARTSSPWFHYLRSIRGTVIFGQSMRYHLFVSVEVLEDGTLEVSHEEVRLSSCLSAFGVCIIVRELLHHRLWSIF